VRSLRSWIATLIARGLKPGYLQNEASRVAAVLRARYGTSADDERALAATHAQLARVKYLFVTRQAAPATARHVRRIAYLRPGHRATLFIQLLWAAAARPSDLARVLARDVSFPRPCGVQMRYRLTKSQQTGSVRKVVFFLPPPVWWQLVCLKQQCPPSAPILPFSASNINNFLRSLALPLTSYSFRRGAVQRMLDADVPPREICRLTGHKNERTLLIYADRVPPRSWRAMQLAASALWTTPL
jgi:hypothetical protein